MDRYKKVSLEEMLNMLVKSIIQKKKLRHFIIVWQKTMELFKNLYQ